MARCQHSVYTVYRPLSQATSHMRFKNPLIPTILQRRYKRFLADVTLENGETLTVHCPNPGAMMGLSDAGSRCWISDSQNPKRKLRYTLELVEANAPTGKVMVGINTMWPNHLAREAIEANRLPELNGYDCINAEVPYGENSRIDFLLSGPKRPPCYIEVKNVHLVRKAGLHEFPDCKTARGAKHLEELARVAKSGARAVMLYILQREDGDKLSFAADLDPLYARAFTKARAAGVEAYALRCHVTTNEIIATTPVPVITPNLEEDA